MKLCPYFRKPCLREKCLAYEWGAIWGSDKSDLDDLLYGRGMKISHDADMCLALQRRPLGKTRPHGSVTKVNEDEGN